MEMNYPEEILLLKESGRWEIIPRLIDREAWQMWELLRKQYAEKNPRPRTFVEIAAQRQEILRLYPLKEELRKVKNELSSLKVKFQKVMDFVDSMKLMQKLEEFLRAKRAALKR